MNAVRSDQIFGKQKNSGGFHVNAAKRDCPINPKSVNFRVRNDSVFGNNWLRNANNLGNGKGQSSGIKALVVAGTNSVQFNSARSRSALKNSAFLGPQTSSALSNSTHSRSGTSGNRTPSRSPRTPTSACSGSNTLETKCIVALTEGRGKARGEVGIAAIDVYRPNLIVSQISDCQTYSKTIAKINMFSPVEILLPNTFCDGSSNTKLFDCIREQYPNITITTVQRRHFSDVQGLESIKKFCVPEMASLEIVVQNKFFALSAASALLKYVEFLQNIMFAPKSLSIQYQGSQNTMLIDAETAKRLELVRSIKPGGANIKQSSLLGVLNHTFTIGGYRLLRATIMQPPCKIEGIIQRQECIQELVDNPAVFRAFQCILPKFADAEKLLALSMMLPTTADRNEKSIEYQINYALLLKSCLDNLPVLQETLRLTEHAFFQTLHNQIKADALTDIQEVLKKVLHDDAKSVKGYSASCIQRCFAIKSEVNVLLDLARRTYYLVQDYSAEHGLPLRVGHNTMKGFHLQMPVGGQNNKWKEKELPEIFIQVNKTRSTFTMTTEALIKLDVRCKEMLKEIQTMSALALAELLAEVRQHAGCLYQMCEAISEIDLIVSLATLSSLPGFIKPEFGNKMVVKAGRHPILNRMSYAEPVPNDIEASEENNFHIVTGPNMAGKSIYIRQVALLQIMAQIGCFVSAEAAEFRITDRIFSRIGFEDSIEGNASTFVVEMREMNYILQQMTPSSLIIIDELCRGTSSEEGMSIAWGICEWLLRSPAFTFFTTHFLFLTRLQNIYSNIQNLCLEAIEMETDSKDGSSHDGGNEKWIQYTHKVGPGVMKIERYGLRLARVSHVPKKVTKNAGSILDKLIAARKPLPSVENGEQGTMMYQTFRCMLKAISKKYVDNRTLAMEMNAALTRKFKEQHSNWQEETLMMNTPLSTPQNRQTNRRVLSPIIREFEQEGEMTAHHQEIVPVAAKPPGSVGGTEKLMDIPDHNETSEPCSANDIPMVEKTPISSNNEVGTPVNTYRAEEAALRTPNAPRIPKNVTINLTPVEIEASSETRKLNSGVPLTPASSKDSQFSRTALVGILKRRQDFTPSSSCSLETLDLTGTPVSTNMPKQAPAIRRLSKDFSTPQSHFRRSAQDAGLNPPTVPKAKRQQVMEFVSPSKLISTPIPWKTPSEVTPEKSTQSQGRSSSPVKMKTRKIEEYFIRFQRNSVIETYVKEKTPRVCNDRAEEENENFLNAAENSELTVAVEQPNDIEIIGTVQSPIHPSKIDLQGKQNHRFSLDNLLKDTMKRINLDKTSGDKSVVTSFSYGSASFSMPIMSTSVKALNFDINEAESRNGSQMMEEINTTPVQGHRFAMQGTPEFRCSMTFKDFMEQKTKQKKRSTSQSSIPPESPSMQKFYRDFPPSSSMVQAAQDALEKKLERMRNESFSRDSSQSGKDLTPKL
ncbi:mutS protein homolog 4-like isoform X2 [Neocloeon triangulifer]|uniref:mutS protein homolog 4-like isoform X2 n=1 Tax=Neocloeon triangulifer TaxID=2078957 RepID=UPI00286ECB1A|nr:mutS protein homolog 4-like isoform X2 [Neocloeon triangulifer]